MLSVCRSSREQQNKGVWFSVHRRDCCDIHHDSAPSPLPRPPCAQQRQEAQWKLAQERRMQAESEQLQAQLSLLGLQGSGSGSDAVRGRGRMNQGAAVQEQGGRLVFLFRCALLTPPPPPTRQKYAAKTSNLHTRARALQDLLDGRLFTWCSEPGLG